MALQTDYMRTAMKGRTKGWSGFPAFSKKLEPSSRPGGGSCRREEGKS